MPKTLIISFISIFALIDIIAIIYPSIKKCLKKRNKKKQQKTFAKKMKDLEIK